MPGVYSDAYADAGLTYPSTSYLDDMAYAAAWMYGATKVSPLSQQDTAMRLLSLALSPLVQGSQHCFTWLLQ